MAQKLVESLRNQARKYGGKEALRFSGAGKYSNVWTAISWQSFYNEAVIASRAFCKIGIKQHECIAVCSNNSPQILISEFGAFMNRAAAIPVYASSSQEQFDFIVTDGEAKVICVGEENQYRLAYDYWKRHKDKLLKIIVYHPESFERDCDGEITISWEKLMKIGAEADEDVIKEVDARNDKAIPSDLATLIYTSGTTGTPKGVEILHSNYNATMEMHLSRLKSVSDADLSMSFLPMSHILEKAWCFFCITKGIKIAINYDPRIIQETIHDVHPNLMCCVPRFWEKVYVSVRDKIATMSAVMRLVVKFGLWIGSKRNLGYVRKGEKAPWIIEKCYCLFDKVLFSNLKKAIGIPDPNMFPTAGAPLSDKICAFMRSVGIDVVVGYGLSETTATVTCFPDVNYQIGTVGTPLTGIDVKISQEGEILVKAPTVTPGYFKNPKANEEAFTPEGYFRTGDCGYFNESGALVLTERIKDLFKTANGKYIAPQALESRLAENKYIDEVAVIGEGRKYVAALIVPNFPNLKKWASSQGISDLEPKNLVENVKVQEFVFRQVNNVQHNLASYEQIKKIALLPNHFSIMNGEVTNTMKVRRPIVAKRYSREIENMYKE